MSKFKCGTFAIPVDTTAFSVSANIGFVPDSLQLHVRQPSQDNDIVSANLIGNATETGFSVALTASAPTTGYVLDWVAFSENGATPIVAGDTLAISYDELKKAVARFLGYDVANLTNAQKDEVDDYIQSGVRNFYYPPKMEGVDENFEWSFLRQAGAVTTSSGISDYALPDGFGRITGQLRIATDSNHGPRPNIVVIPYGEIKAMLDGKQERGTPKFASYISLRAYGERGQSKKLVLYPIPDGEYAIDFDCDADNGKIDSEERPFPLGGAMFSELIKESCLAVAEREANDEEGVHTASFNRLLVSSIGRDRKSGAHNYGFIGVQDAPRW